MVTRPLARALCALAAAQLALAGCHAKSSRDQGESPGRYVAEEGVREAKGEAAAMIGGTATGTAAPAYAPGKARPAAPGPAPDPGTFVDHGTNAWTSTEVDHLSTFAADVDTAAYTITRRLLGEGSLPPPAAVRVEELVNYFRYAYPPPTGDLPFAVHVDAAPSPFGADREIVRVGVTTKAKSKAERKAANLVFLVDVSGSMAGPDRIELAKRSLRILVDNLGEVDRVALVTYAGSTRVVLEPTGLDERARIHAAIEDLTAGGSTAMGSGIELAYAQAARMMRPGTVTRVIVLSDGDANVGPSSHEAILATIEGKVREGITLSTIGFGMGNYRDAMMEQLANKGNGNNYYVDSLSEAKRIFQEQLGATLEVVAKDVKLQVDFDPRQVARYRLIGYENRAIADDDFRRDEVDAGEIGAGHQVTALYEIERRQTITADVKRGDALVTVRVRHKAPTGVDASEAAFPFANDRTAASFAAASADLRFAFAVAAFADVLRAGRDADGWDLAAIRDLAAAAAGDDPARAELVGLIDRAIELRRAGRTAQAP